MQHSNGSDDPDPSLSEIRLFVRPGLARAFQRCLWILVNEEDRDRLEIMEEVIHDFLVKKGC